MSKEYYLYVNGQRVKVSEQIYKVYWREKEHDDCEYSGAAEPLFRKSGNRLSGIGNRRIA